MLMQYTIEDLGPAAKSRALAALPSWLGAEYLETVPVETAAQVVVRLPSDRATMFLRGTSKERREQILNSLGFDGESLRSRLRFPEGTAGALMDPSILSFPETLFVPEARSRIGAHPNRSIHYLYIVDGEQRLVGVLNNRELMLAPKSSRLKDIALREMTVLSPSTPRGAVAYYIKTFPAKTEYIFIHAARGGGVLGLRKVSVG